MKRKFLVMLALVLAIGANAQDFKIGYTNIDAIVFNMPEMDGINSELDTYQQQLGTQIQTKQAEIQTKYQALVQMSQDPNAVQAVLQEKDNELQKLQRDLQAFQTQAEQAYNNKQSTLMNPIYTKVQAAIEEVRKEGGFSLILNAQVTGAGPVIIAGEDDLNITEKVFEKLGVPMPDLPEDGGAPAAGNDGNN
mgnify:FL=1